MGKQLLLFFLFILLCVSTSTDADAKRKAQRGESVTVAKDALSLLRAMESSDINKPLSCHEPRINDLLLMAHKRGMELLKKARKEADRPKPNWQQVLRFLDERLDVTGVEIEIAKTCPVRKPHSDA